MGYANPSENVVVRRLYAPDLPEIRAHLLRLDTVARNARFCGAASDLTIVTYAQKILRNNSIVCGAWTNGHLRGLAELRGVQAFVHSTAEAAISVEPDWQDIGIDDVLFAYSMTLAQNRFVKSVQFIFQKSNIRMWHLAQKHHAVLSCDQDFVDAKITPTWPTPISLAAEFYGDHLSYGFNAGIDWAHRENYAPSNRFG